MRKARNEPTIPTAVLDRLAIERWESEGGRVVARNETATVRRMFAAFAAGNLDALLETVHPLSRWTYYGANPRISKAEFTGHAEVRSFFERILTRLDMTAFHAEEFVTQGRIVVVFGNESGTVKATGQPFHNEWVQKYVVADGLIVQMTEWNIQTDPSDARPNHG